VSVVELAGIKALRGCMIPLWQAGAM
jgi:hypothetical protein